MLAKQLAEELMKYPDSKVTFSLSGDDENHIFAETVIEVTSQGYVLTIVIDL